MTVPELQDRWGVSPENIDREMVVRKNLKYLIDRSTLEEAAAKEVILNFSSNLRKFSVSSRLYFHRWKPFSDKKNVVNDQLIETR